MKTCEFNHYTAQSGQKCNLKALSLDYPMDKRGKVSFGSTIADPNADLYAEMYVEQLCENFSPKEKVLIDMRVYGYSDHEIAKKCSIKKPEVKRVFDTMYHTICDMMTSA